MLERLGTQRLLALFAAGWLLFNFPLLALWDHDTTLWGLPLFPVALFALWGVLIAAVAWTLERGVEQLAPSGAAAGGAAGASDTTEPPERR